MEEFFQQAVVDQLCKEKEFAEGDVHVLQVEGVEGPDGDIVERAAPIGIVDDVGEESGEEQVDESVDPEAVALSSGVEAPDLHEEEADHGEENDIEDM